MHIIIYLDTTSSFNDVLCFENFYLYPLGNDPIWLFCVETEATKPSPPAFVNAGVAEVAPCHVNVKLSNVNSACNKMYF